MLHKILPFLRDAPLPATGKALYIKTAAKHLIQWGTGAPSGTPAAMLYFRTDGTTTTTVLYADVNGTWTAITIA